MKKILALLLALLMILGTFASCGGKSSDKDDPDDEYEENEEENKEKETVIGENSESNAENDGENTENGGESVICTQHTGGTATCTQKAICSVCGKFYGEIDPQNHTGEAKWVESSDNNHKKVYDCCTKEIVSQENHEWHDGKCVDCSYECKHSYGSWNTIKESSCTEKGSKNRKCTICSEIEEDIIDMLDHQCVTVGEIKDCGGNTVFEAKICIECGYTENLSDEPVVIHPHSFIRREPVEPTCTEEGCSVWFECENCGYDVKETIDALDHKWGGTCYRHDEIYHKYKCTRSQCNAELKELHDVNSWRVISLPTCTKDGSIGGYCVDCGQWCTKILLAGHNYDAGEETKKPTCTEKGTMLYTCTECGHTTEADIAPLGHDFQNYVLTNTNAEDPCEHVSECSRSECDAKDYKTIHDDGPWTLTNNPDNLCEHSKECSRCERRVYSTIHDFDNGTVTKEPNCLEGGNKLYICQRCEFEKNQSLAAHGHDYEIFKQVEPTCTENGYTIYKCKRCGNLKTVHCKSLGHIETLEYNDDYHWKKCERCKNNLSNGELHNLEVKFDKEEKATETVYSLYYFCDTCEYKKLIKEGVAHVHNKAEIIPAVAPTCTEGGKLPGLKCATEGCEDVFIEPEAVEALGHNFVNRKCSRCGELDYSVGLRFTSNGDNTCYVSGKGTCTDTYIIIPKSSPNGDSVTSIGKDAFENCSNLTSVTIPNSVTSIGYDAFRNCTNLTSVTIGSGVTSIGEDAFSGCDSLTSVTIPNSVTSIGSSAFENCTSLTSVTIPNSVTSIGSSAFEDCTNLTSVTIPNSVTSIGDNAFRFCYKLVEVINKSSRTFTKGSTSNGYVAYYALEVHSGESKIKTQGDYQFYTVGGVNYLFNYIGSDTELTLPENYNGENYVINDYAFYYNDKITKVTIPDSVTSIGYMAFYNCSSLTSVTIGSGVTSIGNYAFNNTAYCKNESNWENGVLYIGKYLIDAKTDILGVYTVKEETKLIADFAFAYCDSLTSVTIGNNVMSIGSSPFYNCSSLTRITVDESNTAYKSIDGNLYSKDGKTLIQYAIGKDAISFTIPNSVTSIGSSAFENCDSLTSVTIPNSVTSIGNSAFADCDSLTSVTIPNSVTSIGFYAFNGCSNLTSVTIGNGVTSIGDNAFEYCCKLVEVIDKSSLGIRKGSRGNGYVAYYALEVHDVESKIVNKNGYLFYTVGGVNYLVNYIGNGTELTLPANYNEENYVINKYAFSYNDKITKVTISDGVTSIGDYAFSGCSNLTSVTIGNGVTSIGVWAFSGCNSLTSVTIPNSVTSIGRQAFLGRSSLTSVYYDGDIASWCNISFGSDDANPVYYAKKLYIKKSGTNEYELLTNLVIPDSVTEIKYAAFWNCSSLTSVTIGNSVTSIGSYAFSGCYKLVEVINKSSLTLDLGSTSNGYVACYALEVHDGESKIANKNGYLFYTEDGVNYLVNYIGSETELTLPEIYNGENYEIYKYSFYHNDKITKVTIPDSVTSIGERAFYGCSNLTSVTIGNGVTSIGDYAFRECDNLTSVTIGNGVTSIGDYAFYNCTNLTSVTIGNGVTSIGDYAFYNCTNLTSVTIGSGVTSIGYQAFYSCDSLTSVTIIGNGVTSIGAYAFKDCDSLTSVTIGSGVTSIGNWAFCNCDNLTSVIIGNDVTSIGSSAFWGCYKLVEVINKSSFTITKGTYSYGEVACYALEVHDRESKIKTQGDYQFYTVGGVNYLFNYIGNDTELTLPANYNEENYVINKYAFYNNDNITKVTIPDSVTSIGNSAFYNCSNLTSVTIGNSVTSIGSSAFCGCTNLTSITIPDSVTSIGSYAFEYCSSLTSVTIGNSVTSIGYEAFSGCIGLKSVTIPNSVTSIDGTAFSGCDSLTSITVDANNSTYKSIDGNLYSKNGKRLIQYAIGKTDTSFAIPNGVTSIGERAFYNCDSLTSITIPSRVTSIGRQAFEDCDSLTSITIPNSVTSIGSYAFWDCSSLTSVTIGNGVKSIGDRAFYNTAYYKNESNWENGVLYIGKYLIEAKTYMSGTYTVKDGTKLIAAYAFRSCDSLTSVTIPDSVTSIGDTAFSGCDSLTSIKYRGTQAQWAKLYAEIPSSCVITYNYTGE